MGIIMAPKEKANELVVKFMRYVPADESMELTYAKQCALIAVDELINVSVENSFWNKIGIIASDYKQREHWQQVKAEIELL